MTRPYLRTPSLKGRCCVLRYSLTATNLQSVRKKIWESIKNHLCRPHSLKLLTGFCFGFPYLQTALHGKEEYIYLFGCQSDTTAQLGIYLTTVLSCMGENVVNPLA